jgi:hypothetical protein
LVWVQVRGFERGQGQEVKGDAPPQDADVQVGPRDPSGGARLAELLPAHDVFALVHGKLGEVHVDGKQTLTVVEEDAVPLVEQLARQNHRSGVGG